jgi:hypothetical protein
MDEGMPPPPAGQGSFEAWEQAIDAPPAATRRRPLAVSVAGWLLIVAGVFAVLAAVLILVTGDGARVEGVGADASSLAVGVALVLAGLEIAAGVLVLRAAPFGRSLGIVVAALGIVGGLAAIASPKGAVTVAIFGFVVYGLATNAEAFRATHDG